MSLLSSRLELFDVPDVEDLCNQIIHRTGLDLNYHEREELTAYLIETCWLLSLRYDPCGISSFGIFARRTLSLRSVDWLRKTKGRTRWQTRGRTYERAAPRFVSSTPLPVPTEIDWNMLSPEAAWTTVHVAWPISLGLSTREVAAQVGETNAWVTKRLSALTRELASRTAP